MVTELSFKHRVGTISKLILFSLPEIKSMLDKRASLSNGIG